MMNLYAVHVLVALVLGYLAHVGQASPVLEARQSITTLTTAQVASFRPFTFYASAAYCQPAATLTWSCGANCNANAGFIPVASGGNGNSQQFWFVGFDPTLATVVVSHQGTDTSQILAVATDLNAFLEPLNTALFPGVSSSIEVHNGFMLEQAMTATTILTAVTQAMSAHGVNKVTVVGHSLGAAIALIDGVYLSLHLPGTSVQVFAYGLPRVGNQAWANFVDSLAPNLSIMHVNNKKDPIPIVPGRSLGYHHPSGEVHIMASNAWVACPGQDNTSNQCTVGNVPNIFVSDPDDHSGPYDGVEMGC